MASNFNPQTRINGGQSPFTQVAPARTLQTQRLPASNFGIGADFAPRISPEALASMGLRTEDILRLALPSDPSPLTADDLRREINDRMGKLPVSQRIPPRRDELIVEARQPPEPFVNIEATYVPPPDSKLPTGDAKVPLGPQPNPNQGSSTGWVVGGVLAAGAASGLGYWYWKTQQKK